MTDGSDEPFGLVALAICGWLAWRKPWPGVSERRFLLATVGVGLLALAPAGTPPLLRATIWVVALAALAARSAAWAGLLAYSLPVMASAQFFGGYPVRVAVTWAAAGVLRLLGLAVSPVATVLVWHHQRVLIDAPCSGLEMAWLAGLFGLILANVYELNAKHTARLLLFAGAVTFVANVLRASFLFLLETQLRVSAEWMHDAVGLVLFALVVAAVLARVSVEREKAKLSVAGPSASNRAPRRTHRIGPFRVRPLIATAFALSATVVAARPFCETHRAGSDEMAQATFPGWDEAPIFAVKREGDVALAGLRQVPLDARTRRFAADFPGKLGIFFDGKTTWIVRWVLHPTRKLHSASDCLRAAGYRVVPGRARADGKGALWSSFEAKRDTEDLRVCERIVGPGGFNWSDVSAWFWDTFFDGDAGPWWAITEIEPETGDMVRK